MAHSSDTLLALLIPAVILLHLVFAPYSKVEESFNLQATYDILTYGIPTKDIAQRLQQYDHSSFPGAVPRTFVGALVLAGASKPFIWLSGSAHRQLIVRGLLGLFNAFALVSYKSAVARAFGRSAATWYLLLQASQFHVIYYATRTLPNMFAFGLSTLALQNVLPPNMASSASISATKRNRLSIYLLTMTGVVFRSEIAILLAAQTLYLLLNRRVTLQNEIIPAGIGGALVGLLLTVSVDSFFWERFPLWPEFVGFYYNAIEGKSSEWGTSAWSFYFTNAIPRLLMNPMTWEVCIPMAIAMKATRRASIDILLPLLLFIGVYSLQPHKEWRFIVYAVPGFTAVASLGASWIWSRRSKSMVYRLLGLALLASTVGSFTVSFGMLAISQLNYPGAEALSRLHNLAHGSQVIINVHLDTLSCMSGITRFQEIPPPHAHSPRNHTLWKYDKTEDPQDLLHPAFWERFDYVLAERPETVIGRWEIIDTVDGFAGVSLRSPEDRDIGRFETVSAERGLRSALYDYTVGWLWKDAENLIRDHVTRGWWIGIRMEPKIRILKKQRAPQRIAPG